MSHGFRFPHAHGPHLSADQLRRRYVVALSLIAILTIAAQLLLQLLISDQSYDSRVVNIAGRQRMLSQKITKLGYYVSSAASPEAAARYRADLRESLKLWQRAHDGLLHGDREQGLPGKNSDQVVALYEAIEPHYAAIVAAARSIVDTDGNPVLLPSAIGEMTAHESEFLKGMDQIVFRYDHEANSKVEFTRRIEVALMMVTLLVLLLEAALIFAPATRRIRRDMQELADREQDLGLLFSASPTALLLIDDENLGILHANQEAADLFATTVDALTHAPLSTFVVPDVEPNRRLLEKLAAGGAVNAHDVVLRGAGQSTIQALLSARSIRFSGNSVLVIGVTDITEFKKAQQTLAAETRSVEERNRELSLLYEVTSYLAEPSSREAVCKGMLTKLSERLGVGGGVVRLMNAATRELEIIASHNMPEPFLKAEARLATSTCLCGRAAAHGTSVAGGISGRPHEVTLLSNCSKCGYAAVAAIPICSKKQVLGVMTLFFNEERVLAPDELRLLEAIGLHLGVVIENLHLVLREKEMAVSEERNLLAQELHDSIAQALAFLNIQSQMLQQSLNNGELTRASAELALMREGIQESYDNVRELLVHFRIRVDHTELDDAIRSALEKFEGQTGLRTSFSKTGDSVIPAATSAIQVLHILQEALSNVRKHAAATAVEVTMRGDAECSIAVCDDGQGFDPRRLSDDGDSHVGIGIMRERAHRIGARLELDAAPGRGTRVTLVLPQGDGGGVHGTDDTRAVSR